MYVEGWSLFSSKDTVNVHEGPAVLASKAVYIGYHREGPAGSSDNIYTSSQDRLNTTMQSTNNSRSMA